MFQRPEPTARPAYSSGARPASTARTMADDCHRKVPRSAAVVYPSTSRASFYLGPESPRPFAVLSEQHLRRRIDLPETTDCGFGAAYDARLCELIDGHLELDPRDRLCYVGADDVTNLLPLLQQRFCLLQPITVVVPGHVLYAESQRRHRRMPIKVAHVGAQEYFRRAAAEAADGPPPFDKVIVKDAVAFFDDARQTFADMATLLPPGGRLLVLERPAPLVSLPLFRDVTERLAETQRPYMEAVRALRACRLSVTWSVESLPVVTTRPAWLALLRARQPASLLDVASDAEIVAGLRELSEGALKYADDALQFVDRLLVIAATTPADHCSVDRQAAPPARRNVTVPRRDVIAPLRYEMALTDDIKRCMSSDETPNDRKLAH